MMISARPYQKALKMVLLATLLGAQYYKASTGTCLSCYLDLMMASRPYVKLESICKIDDMLITCPF